MSKRTAVAATVGIAIMLASGFAGCALLPGKPGVSPEPTQVATTTAAPSQSAKPTPTPTTPSPSPSSAAVKASGRLSLYQNNLVTKALVGTCVVAAGKPTITLADHKNDFYGTVDATIVLDADGGEVASIDAAFGEDSELISRKLVHPASGTSAQLVTADGVYRVSGKLMVYENESTSGTLIPYSMTAKCASSHWLG